MQSADDVVYYAVFVALQGGEESGNRNRVLLPGGLGDLKALGQFGVADVDAECYSNALANKGLDTRDDGCHGELVVVIVRCAW